MTRSPLHPAQRARITKRLRWLVRFLDNAIPIPGTNIRFGFDAVLGLLPAAGDTISAAASLYIVYQGHRLGAPSRMVTEMVANVAIDWLIGLVPLAGDVGDVFFRANMRNLTMLEGAGLLGSSVSEPSGPSASRPSSQDRAPGSGDPDGRVNVRVRPINA